MRTILLLFIIAVTPFACSGEVGSSYDRAGVDQRYQVVYTLTQDLACTDSAECASIGIGSKPCGGPWRNLVYSSTTVDLEKLQAAVADLNFYEAGYNQQEGLTSDCSLAPPAEPSCMNNLCVDLNAAQ